MENHTTGDQETNFLKFLKDAVSSNSPLMSSGYGSPFTMVNGFISINEKSKSAKEEQIYCEYGKPRKLMMNNITTNDK